MGVTGCFVVLQEVLFVSLVGCSLGFCSFVVPSMFRFFNCTKDVL